MAELFILTGENTGKVFALPDIPTVVGRSAEAHVQITDPWISSMLPRDARGGGLSAAERAARSSWTRPGPP